MKHNNKSEAQLELFEPGKSDNKMKEVGKQDKKIKPGVIYQKDGIDFEGRIVKKIKEIIEDDTEPDDLPF